MMCGLPDSIFTSVIVVFIVFCFLKKPSICWVYVQRISTLYTYVYRQLVLTTDAINTIKPMS